MNPSVSVCSMFMTRIGQGVGDVGGEVFPLRAIFEIFEFGECSRGNKVVVSLGMVL